MVDQPRRNFMKLASWSRTSEHLVNSIGMSDQLKWNNQRTMDNRYNTKIQSESTYSSSNQIP